MHSFQAINALTALAQIAFWLTISTITVLTYLHARKTVLQPLRTEVFKLQLEEVRDVLQAFVGRDESQLRADAHLSDMFEASAALMFDQYAEARFPVKVDKEERPYSKCRTWAMSPEAIVLANNDVRPPEPEPSTTAPWQQRPWEDYKHLGIPIPNESVDYRAKIERMVESPILPTVCARLLEEYLGKLEDNQDVIARAMESAALEMTARYDSIDRLRASEIAWLHNAWNSEVIDLKPTADKITAFARAYFKSDDFVRASQGREVE